MKSLCFIKEAQVTEEIQSPSHDGKNDIVEWCIEWLKSLMRCLAQCCLFTPFAVSSPVLFLVVLDVGESLECTICLVIIVSVVGSL